MTNQQQPTLPGTERRERAKHQLFLHLNRYSNDTPADNDLEAILNICQDGTDALRASSELQGEFATLLEIVRKMRAEQKAFYKASPGTSARRDALKESKDFERMADQFVKNQDAAANAKPETPTLF